jgi:hypothetical protein
MKTTARQRVNEAKHAALAVLRHNMRGPYQGLPRTAGWGYPEPYTRDLMLSLLGIAVSEDHALIESLRKVLEALAKNQTEHGHIPSLVHRRNDRGASDTTPLFLLAIGIFRKVTGERRFLQRAALKAMTWIAYQSPVDGGLVAQQPTSDWRDEQWVMGYGLYVNTLVYACLRLFDHHDEADRLSKQVRHATFTGNVIHRHGYEGFGLAGKPYFALRSYKLYSSERLDLLGNSLAILSGLASPSRARAMIAWIEAECRGMRQSGELALDLPPNFFPFIQPGDPDWRLRYEKFNLPGEYHNGGIWPFVSGLYVAALVAAQKYQLAEQKLVALTDAVQVSNQQLNPNLRFGFNEWLRSQDGEPMGQNWQTWSAALYLYAAKCVETRETPFFDAIRTGTA